MTPLRFEPVSRPFPRWPGPFSPSTGKYSGFRFHSRQLGAWVTSASGRSFWPVVDSQGSRAIENLVRREWGGGRVLFLPCGLVIKPLPGDEEVGQRVVIGRFRGSLVLRRQNRHMFNLSAPGDLVAGEPWPGPNTIGLACVLNASGALTCSWSHPTTWGRDLVSCELRGPDTRLAAAFRRARRGDTTGRVRITAGGHVFTNRELGYKQWRPYYVGYIDPSDLSICDDWIGELNNECA